MQVVVIPALLVRGNEAWIGYGLILILIGYGIVLWHAPSRAKAMAQVGSQLGMHFEPIMSRAQLGIKGTTFDVGYPGENCLRGKIAGRETLDHVALDAPTIYLSALIAFWIAWPRSTTAKEENSDDQVAAAQAHRRLRKGV